MANVKITELPSLSGATSVSADLIPVVDVSVDITSSMTRGEFFTNVPALTMTGLFSSANVAITGGSITGITDLAIADGGTGASTSANARTNLGLGTIATQNANAVTITGGSITGITDLAVADGGTGASTLTGYVKGAGTTALTASATIPNTDISGLGTMSTQAASAVTITGGSINGTTVGATTQSSGSFTTLAASSTVSGTGFSTYLASPPAIGGTAAASIRGSSLTSTSVITDSFATRTAGTLALAFATNGVVQVTPNATGTFTTTVPPAGTRATLIVLTSGTTTYTMTFGTGFKTTGTLVTGVLSARYFILEFISDGTNLIESSRTIAIA